MKKRENNKIHYTIKRGSVAGYILRDSATVMQNYTVCIPKEIRKLMGGIKPSDKLAFMYEGGKIVVKKVPSEFVALAGLGKKTYQKLGGGETYLHKERNAWKK